MLKLSIRNMKLQFVIILICYTVCGYAQKPQGKFVQQYAIDGGIVLNFDHNKFIYEKGGCLNTEFGKGTFTFRDQELRLKFKEVKDQESSHYHIKNTSQSDDSIKIKLRTLDKEGFPLQAPIAIRDKNHKVIEQFYADKNGRLSISMKTSNRFVWLTVYCMGFYGIELPISKLKNKYSEIEFKLSPAEIYYIPRKTVVYKIDKFNYDQLVLMPTDHEKLFFSNRASKR